MNGGAPTILVIHPDAERRAALVRELEAGQFHVVEARDTHFGFQLLIDDARIECVVLGPEPAPGAVEGFLRLTASYLRVGGIPIVLIADVGARLERFPQVRSRLDPSSDAGDVARAVARIFP